MYINENYKNVFICKESNKKTVADTSNKMAVFSFINL